MVIDPGKMKATLRKTSFRICSIYTTKRKTSSMEKLLLVISCLITSLILAVLLFLALLFPFKCGIEVSMATTGVFWLCITIAMCFSQRIRCFGTLFLMSIGLKQGKNLLIMAGTTVVIFLNIQNILKNLRGLAKSLLCTVEAKVVAINLPPFSNYIRMLNWVAGQLKKGLPSTLIGNYFINFTISPTVHSQNFTEKMAEAERALNETAESVLAVIDTVSSAGKTVSPVLGVVLLLILTALYLKRFRSDPEHDNIFITRSFIKYDERQRLQGKPSAFPLSKKESKRYIMVPSASFTKKEAKAMLKFSIPIVTHSLAWVIFVGVDALLYWIIVTLRRRLEELKPLHVPVVLEKKNKAFFAGVAVKEDQKECNFSYDVPIFENKCLPEPELWLYESLIPLSVIFGLLVLLVLVSSKMDQLRLLVSEQFFSDHAEERIAVLHERILSRRSKKKVQTAEVMLKSFATQLRFWCPILFRREQNNPENNT
ncbi:dendritic cell-specific transmembrane protein [Salminus brasiliensis]|uniref:dendritic cell-specific transmembrane protein n=1 Tax=Salminus brasiliensis TaxID=930266 RepID=UPI003B8328EA